jgi:single-stranded-DNA-specific exonuclease
VGGRLPGAQPVRIRLGLTPEIVTAAERQPGLIITVDNGIASVGGVAAAHRAGIDVRSPTIICGVSFPNRRIVDESAGVRVPSKHLAGSPSCSNC